MAGRPKGSKNKVEGEEEIGEMIAVELQDAEVAPETPVINPELEQLRKLHKEMTDRGIRDIGQLEVFISRLQ